MLLCYNYAKYSILETYMKILVSALEPSSLAHLEKIKPLLNKNINLVMPPIKGEDTAIIGIIGAIAKFMFFKQLLKKMTQLAKECDKVLLMDSSGFNMALMKSIKKAYPTKHIVYYILPQAWAWRKGRIDVLGQECDKICSIWPFEEPLYAKYKDKYNYVGHPILDDINCKSIANTKSKDDYIVILPGSRKSEIIELMPIYKRLVKKISKKAYLIIPKAFSEDKIEQYYGDISEFEISNDFVNIVKDATFVFVCSGTASLQCAILGVAHAICYKARAFDFFVGSKIFKMKYVGLANIIFEKLSKKPPYKELLQQDCNEIAMYEYYLQVVNNADKKAEFKANAKVLSEYLKYPSSKNMADILNEPI